MRTLLLFAFISLTAGTSFAQHDTIANAGFERWAFNPQYDEPEDWTTLNPLASILGAELAFRATASGEFHSGTSAIKLVTTNIPGIGMAPSICTNGIINTAQQTIEGGVPISSRPISFGGWFRFDPVNSDTGNYSITLTRWNSVTNSRDIIGTGSGDFVNTNGVFENFEVALNYQLTDVPDTVLILLGSGTDVNPQEGTTLFVDDLYYTYPQGIETPESVGLKLFPNPTTDGLTINSKQGFEFSSATVYSLDGRLMLNAALNSINPTVDVADLVAGTYIIELATKDGTIVRQSFLKN